MSDALATRTIVLIRPNEAAVPNLRLTHVASGASVPLGLNELTIGSSEDADFSVQDDDTVSRLHCRLSIDEHGLHLIDLESKNGTFIGPIRIERSMLPIATSFSCGNSIFSVVDDGTSTNVSISPRVRFGEAIGSGIKMRRVFSLLEKVSSTEETVLLLGESGTGKQVLAEAIHANSRRKDAPFVTFDCSSASGALIASDLFGHVRGAFTGAERSRNGAFVDADGGTLFIDEIGELPLALQPMLLRALEAREVTPVGGTARDVRAVNVRIVAATNRPLTKMIADRTFREDLYYRLAVFPVDVPPLRERRDDVSLLVDQFLRQQDPSKSLRDLPPARLRQLEKYDWPGNVRELRNAVLRLAALPEETGLLDVLSLRDQPLAENGGDPFAEKIARLPMPDARALVIDEFERRYLERHLRACDGNVRRAAASMGISRQLAYRLLERHQLTPGRDE